jgi:hypothetical protein
MALPVPSWSVPERKPQNDDAKRNAMRWLAWFEERHRERYPSQAKLAEALGVSNGRLTQLKQNPTGLGIEVLLSIIRLLGEVDSIPADLILKSLPTRTTSTQRTGR